MKRLWLMLTFVLLILISCATKQQEEEKKEEVPKTVFKGTFLEVLNKGIELVKAESAEAALFEADAMKIDTAGMTAEDIKEWRFVYYIPEFKTAFISYKDSIFSNVTIIDQAWMEDCIIKEEVKMDLIEAIELLRKANYSDKFVDLTLRQPLYPGCNEPYYIFSCPKIGWIFVGTVSKKVTVEPFR